MIPAFLGLAGPVLGEAERSFFRAADPAGYILFKRNCVDRAQLRALTDDLRALVGARRSADPDRSGRRPGAAHGAARMAQAARRRVVRQTVREGARLGDGGGAAQRAGDRADAARGRASTSIACRCSTSAGPMPTRSSATVRSAPIRCRSPRSDASCSTACARAASSASSSICRAMAARWRDTPQGAAGRSTASEAELADDMLPFQRLADAPMAMTAHVVYAAWDAERRASQSPIVIRDIIRGRIGFDGLLMSDDLGMQRCRATSARARRRDRGGDRHRAALLGRSRRDGGGGGRAGAIGEARGAARSRDGDDRGRGAGRQLRRSRGQAGFVAGAGVTPTTVRTERSRSACFRRCACSTSFDFAQDERVEGLAGAAMRASLISWTPTTRSPSISTAGKARSTCC